MVKVISQPIWKSRLTLYNYYEFSTTIIYGLKELDREWFDIFIDKPYINKTSVSYRIGLRKVSKFEFRKKYLSFIDTVSIERMKKLKMI